ncbi:MAG: prepilin-type N-terminal cleavage/methylation domain-containing protein, partial [Planctomycetota bacterium]
MKLTSTKKSGFTLLELLVVIAIIAILAGALGIGVLGVLLKAEQSRSEANILAIESAIRQYVEDWKTLPVIGPITGTPPYNFTEIATVNKNLALILEKEALVGIVPIKWTVGPYLFPDRGMTKDPTGGFYSDPWGYPYIIKFPGLNHTAETLPGVNNTNWIDIFSYGPNNTYDTTDTT